MCKASGQDILRIFREYSKDIPRIFWEYTKNIPGVGRGQRTYINSVSGLIDNSVRREHRWGQGPPTCTLLFVTIFWFFRDISEFAFESVIVSKAQRGPTTPDANMTARIQHGFGAGETLRTYRAPHGFRAGMFWESLAVVLGFSVLGMSL